MEQKPINLSVKLRVDKNPIGIPPGTFIDIKVSILDEWAAIWTSNAKFTKDLVKTAKEGEVAKFIERIQKTIVKYPGKSQKEIAEDIAKSFGKLPTG